MLTCKECKQTVISTKEFFSHIKYFHPRTIQIICPYRNCSRFYSNKVSLRSHLNNNTIHSSVADAVDEPLIAEKSLLEGNIYSRIEERDDLSAGNDEKNPSNILSDLKLDMMKHAVELLSDELISRKKSLEILKRSFDIYSKAILAIKTSDSTLNTVNFNEFCEFFEDSSSIESEYKLKKALHSAGVYISAEDHILSSEYDLKYVNGIPKLHKDERIVKIFNVTEFLETFLNLPGIMHEIDTFVKSKENCKDGSISNIIQSPLWEKLVSVEEKNDSILYLPLNIYFDDFEPQNVVGSHSGAYKIGAVYMGLPALPNYMISKLEYIFPVCLFFSEDRETYGNQKVFEPLIKVLNDLHTNGIYVNYGKIRTVKLIVTLILGDNLGINTILGFTESFNANYYCRFCRLKKDIMQKLIVEDINSLRNYENYCKDVEIGKLSLTGISEPCALNLIHKFHATRNFSVDTLHDFFEGCCHYDLCNIIINLINQNCFTLDELNANIKYHNYGPFFKNKSIDPITIEKLQNTKLKTSGEEMRVLLINFGLIIGHRVNRDCPEWRLYLVLREIVTIVTSKTVHRRSHEILKTLVSEHHELYLQCFKYDHLKPKHHLMVHYARILQMIGPIDLVSSMRYESFHKKFKNVANVITCRINLLTTFAKKMEYQNAKFLLNFEKPQNTPTFGKMYSVECLSQKYRFSVESKNVEISNWVEIGGVLIKKNCVIQTGLEMDDSPKFGIVEEIIFIDKSIILLGCRQLENLGFESHFYAYSVLETNVYFLFSPENIEAVSYMYQGNQKTFVCLK